MDQTRLPVIFDTDIGEDIDDLYALYLALLHPKLEVVAVTTAHGNVQGKARLVKKALRLAGRSDIPVGAGIGLSQARAARGEVCTGQDVYVQYVAPSDPESNELFPCASTVISQVMAQSDTPITIIGEGAASNIAQVIVELGDCGKEKIASIAIMAGETRLAMSEYNIMCDPEAAEVVLNSGIDVFLGTFELTSRLRLSMEQVEAAFAGSSDPIHKCLYDCTLLWNPYRGSKYGPVLYDMVPVFWAADRESIETSLQEVHVELCGKLTRGQTVRVQESQNRHVHELADIDPEALLNQFFRIIGLTGS